MKHQHHYNAFQTAVKLTRQEDHFALRHTLVDGILHATHTDQVKLFEIKSDHEDQLACIAYYRDALVQDALFDRVERRRSLLEAVEQRKLVESPINKQGGQLRRYAIPILSSGVVTEVLSIDAKEVSDDELHSIEFLVTIYRNYMLLLNKYERDALTGLLNRRSFEDRLNLYINELDGASCGESIFDRPPPDAVFPHLAVLDIDHFKRVNDTYGHLYGDDVLLLFSNQMKEVFSAETSLYRFGGEEFVVVMKSTESQAREQLEGFRKAIESFDFPQVGRVTVSIGYTGISYSCISSGIIDRADQALYYAKENGRNQVCSYEHLVDDGHIEHKQQAVGSGEAELF